jgi:flagellar M-ring protein FliF
MEEKMSEAGTSLVKGNAEGTVLNVGGGARTPVLVSMPNGISGRAQSLALRIKSLSMVQRMILGAALVLLFAVIAAVGLNGRSKDEYRVLFSNVAERDGAAIIAALQQMNVAYRFTEGGGAILVPGPLVHETRLKLAGQGLPKAGTVGFELLENQKLGTSQFVEQINYQRGLEGELAKSIQSISQVKMARVHLAIPKASAFSRDGPKPTASVVLSLHPGRFLDELQVTAMTNLVSASVPRMSAQSVTVMDAEGNLLAPNPNRQGALGLDAAQLRYVAETEGAIAKRIAAIIEPVAGRDNVRAQVSVDMDFTQVERTEESFKPNTAADQSAVRSQQSLEAGGPITSAGGIPGALSNQPPQPSQAPIEALPPTQQAGAASEPGAASAALAALTAPQTSLNNRKESTINYEVDRAIQTTKGSRGAIKRVSAAVILNYKKGIDKNGKPTSQPFAADEMKQINQMVRDAMGFSQQRGDSVSVGNIPFSVDAPEDMPFWRDGGVLEMVKEGSKLALLLGLVGVVFLAVVRPLLFPPPVPVIDEGQQLEEEMDEKMKIELAHLSPQARQMRRLEMELDKERRRLEIEDKRMHEDEARAQAEDEKRRAEDDRKRTDEDRQREYEELIAYAKDYVSKDAVVVAAVFKDWLSESNNKPVA